MPLALHYSARAGDRAEVHLLLRPAPQQGAREEGRACGLRYAPAGPAFSPAYWQEISSPWSAHITRKSRSTWGGRGVAGKGELEWGCNGRRQWGTAGGWPALCPTPSPGAAAPAAALSPTLRAGSRAWPQPQSIQTRPGLFFPAEWARSGWAALHCTARRTHQLTHPPTHSPTHPPTHLGESLRQGAALPHQPQPRQQRLQLLLAQHALRAASTRRGRRRGPGAALASSTASQRAPPRPAGPCSFSHTHSTAHPTGRQKRYDAARPAPPAARPQPPPRLLPRPQPPAPPAALAPPPRSACRPGPNPPPRLPPRPHLHHVGSVQRVDAVGAEDAVLAGQRALRAHGARTRVTQRPPLEPLPG